MYMILENVQNILKKFDKMSDDFENNEYNLQRYARMVKQVDTKDFQISSNAII